MVNTLPKHQFSSEGAAGADPLTQGLKKKFRVALNQPASQRAHCQKESLAATARSYTEGFERLAYISFNKPKERHLLHLGIL